MDLKSIGENVKKLRAKKGITQSHLAEMADISTVHISHIETGAVSMSMESLISICSALDTTPDSVLLGEYQLSQSSTSAIINEYIEKMTSDEKRLLIEFAKLLSGMNINKK